MTQHLDGERITAVSRQDAAEEFGHVEMLATMIAQLLEKTPPSITVAAVVGGTDVHQAIVAGAVTHPGGPAAPYLNFSDGQKASGAAQEVLNSE